MTVALIVAVSDNNVIGRDGALPWNLPEDLKRFKRLTLGHPVIMGRKTYELLPESVRPLPGRTNIVLTSRVNRLPESVVKASSIEEAITLAEEQSGSEKIFVIGGESVYRAAMPLATEIFLTRIAGYVSGDAEFTYLGDGWNIADSSDELVDGDVRFRFLHYVKGIQ